MKSQNNPAHEEISPDQAKEMDSAIREKFSRRLYAAMIKKGWTQAEMGRRAGLERYNISNYIRGNVLPTALSLEKLAKALDLKPEDLMPNAIEIGMPSKANLFNFSEVEPGKAHLRVDKIVRMSTAMKIGQLIADDDPNASD